MRLIIARKLISRQTNHLKIINMKRVISFLEKNGLLKVGVAFFTLIIAVLIISAVPGLRNIFSVIAIVAMAYIVIVAIVFTIIGIINTFKDFKDD